MLFIIGVVQALALEKVKFVGGSLNSMLKKLAMIDDAILYIISDKIFFKVLTHFFYACCRLKKTSFLSRWGQFCKLQCSSQNTPIK